MGVDQGLESLGNVIRQGGSQQRWISNLSQNLLRANQIRANAMVTESRYRAELSGCLLAGMHEYHQQTFVTEPKTVNVPPLL